MMQRMSVIVFCMLMACGCQRAAEDRLRITLWHQMMQPERVLLRLAIDEFEAAHPEVEIRALYKETEELRNGFQAAVLAGVGPELVFGPSDVIGPYQRMGIVQDMSPWLDSAWQTDFLPAALIRLPELAASGQAAEDEVLLQVGDRIGNHLALVINRHLIEKAPRDSDEMLRYAKQATEDRNGDGVPETYGLVWNFTEPFFAVPFLTGYGTWVFEEIGSKEPNLNTPAAVEAYEFILSLRDEHRVIPPNCDYEMADSLFKSGHAAMIINGDWSWSGYLELENIDAVVAPLPTISATGLPMAPMAATKGYSLSSVARGEAADMAMELVRYMTSTDVQMRNMQRLKTLPSRKLLLDDPLIQDDATLAASALQMKNCKPMPVVSELRAVWDGMRPAYQMLLGGNHTAAQAAAAMQKATLENVELINADVQPSAIAGLIRWIGYGLVACLTFWQRHSFVDLIRDLPKNKLAYVFVAPSLLIIFLTIVFPFFYNVALSFSNMSLKNFQDWQIIGLQNYADVFTNATFLVVFVKTIAWTVINVFFHVALGLFLAVLLNGPVAGKSLYRVLLIIPWAVPAYITALTWRGMFDYTYGAVNLIAARLGLPVINWLNDEWAMFGACLLTNIWLGVPFMMVIALGGMQGIPKSLYEAARIDRASSWDQFWNITVPMLKPVMVPAITLGTIWTFNNLNVIWLVSNGGEPGDKTHILVSYVYRAVFNLYQYSYGAALSMVIFFILLVFSVLFLHRTNAAEGV
jgi:arabinogalactan oligomer/maltooligosaccharide transport system permease protein